MDKSDKYFWGSIAWVVGLALLLLVSIAWRYIHQDSLLAAATHPILLDCAMNGTTDNYGSVARCLAAIKQGDTQ